MQYRNVRMQAFRACGVLFAAWSCAMGAALAQAAGPTAAPAPPNVGLAIGPGDVVRIAVFQNQDLSLELRVDGNGRITYPFLETVDVAGRTAAEIEQMIAAGLEQRQVLKRPQVTVTISQFKSQQIAVLGNVNRPGKYALELPLSLSDAIALAGGITQVGADSVVLSRQADDALRNIEIDLSQMFTPGSGRAQDVMLKAGDVIYVHRAPTFYVYGEVQRPGAFRLERDMTVMQALSLGGGLTPRGTERGLKITRRGGDGKSITIDTHLKARVEPEDVIYVREAWF